MSFAELLSSAWSQNTITREKRGQNPARTYCYASGWWACRYRMYLDLTHPENCTIDDYSLERMARGNDYERAITAHLKNAEIYGGFELVGQQERISLHDRDGNLVISGKTDGTIIHKGNAAIIEVKAGSGVRGIECAQDFERSVWNRKKLRQMLAYLLGTGTERGVFVLETFAAPRFVEVLLSEWYAEAEEFLQAATEACAAARQETAPPERTESTLCQRCGHRSMCAPSIGSAACAGYSNDPDHIEACRSIVEDEGAATRHKRARDLIGALSRGQELVVVGPYVVEGYWQRRGNNDQGAWFFNVERSIKNENP